VTSYATPENAWLADPTPEAFAAALRRMLAHPEARTRKLEAARLTAEAHSWPNVAGRYLDLYAGLHARCKGDFPERLTEPVFFSTPGDFGGRERIGQA
jgi:hypothetical protein